MLGLAGGASGSAQDRANAPLNDPAVVAVRNVYRAVEKDAARQQLRREHASMAECGPNGEERTLFADKAGRVRKYVWESGSSDSALTIRHYYDTEGRLRFVFVTGGAVNNTQIEHRVYLDEAGQRIRETRELKSGPGWTFPQFTDEEGLIVRAPREAFARKCDAAAQ